MIQIVISVSIFFWTLDFEEFLIFCIKLTLKAMLKGDFPLCFNILSEHDIKVILKSQPNAVCLFHNYTFNQINIETMNSPPITKIEIRRDYAVEINQEDGSIRSGLKLRPDFEFQLQAEFCKELEEEGKCEECQEMPWIVLRWKEAKMLQMKEIKLKMLEKKNFQIFVKNLKNQFITEVIDDFRNHYRPEQGIQGESQKFKIVYARRKGDNVQFTVKCYSRKKFPSRELLLTKDLHHPNICRIQKIYRTQKTYYLLLQSHKISLCNWLQMKDRQRIPLPMFIYKLLEAIEYLHQKGIMHRDIKPGNIMLKKDSLQPTLIDYDLAERIDTKQLWSPVCGTYGYMAPQICSLKRKHQQNRLKESDMHYTEACDIFSLGITIFQMLTFTKPFKSTDSIELFKQNEKCEINFNRPSFECLPVEYQQLIRGMLAKNPNQRLTPIDAMKSSLFNGPEPENILKAETMFKINA